MFKYNIVFIVCLVFMFAAETIL